MLLASLLLASLLTGCTQDYELAPEPVDVDPGEVTACDFTRVVDVAGRATDFYAYDCNPVFSTTGEDWAASVDTTAFAVTEVLGHPFYQLWYTGVPDADSYGDYGLGYALSAEGTDWEPVPANPLLTEPAADQWDSSGMDGMQVLWDSALGKYLMLYQGYNLDRNRWGLGVATSSDGQAWKRLPSNPVLDLTAPGPDDVVGYCWPLGLTMGDVTGYTGYIAGYDSQTGPCQVYTMAGADAETWTPSSRLVLPAGERGTWDDEGTISLAIAEQGGEDLLFYVGFGDWVDFTTYRTSSRQYVGWARRDGGEWVKDPDPLPLNQTAEGEVSAIAAQKIGDRVHLWITDTWGDESAVGYFLYDPTRAAAEDAE